MNKSYIKTIYLIALTLILIIAFAGCAGKGPPKKQKKIQQMSDSDLVNYYNGINDRIKDIDNEVRDEQAQQEKLSRDKTFSQSPFYLGGHGHNLVRERELIIKELNKRNLAY